MNLISTDLSRMNLQNKADHRYTNVFTVRFTEFGVHVPQLLHRYSLAVGLMNSNYQPHMHLLREGTYDLLAGW